MASDSNKKLPWQKLPKAKRHSILDAIDGELRGCHRSTEISLWGHTYELRTLDPAEEAWADRYVDGTSLYQAARNRRAPYVAASLVAVDGTPVEALFEVPKDMPEAELEVIRADIEFERAWRRSEVLRWLLERDKHGPFVQKLYEAYIGLEDEREEALGHLDPLSKDTPTGASSRTSSPEKESSQATLL